MCLEIDRKAWFIMIHKFKAKDINILLDVNSGGVHIIDDITYDVLDRYLNACGTPFKSQSDNEPNKIVIVKRNLFLN